MALITFDDHYIWIHSDVGFLNVRVIPNRKKFCGFFPKDQGFFEIEDTDIDDCHKTHVVEIDGVHAKYYAGAKINLPLGEMIGVLCVFDIAPKKLTEKQCELLVDMADVVEKSLFTKSFQKYIK